MTDGKESYFPEGTEHQEVLKTMGLLDFVWDSAKNEHIVNSRGHLAKVEEYDPATMVLRTLTPDMKPTPEQIAELEEAEKHPIVYEDDCPELWDILARGAVNRVRHAQILQVPGEA